MNFVAWICNLALWQKLLIAVAVMALVAGLVFFVIWIIRNLIVKRLVNLAGFAYDSDQEIFYSEMDAWQRNFGYCRLYDEGAALTNMIIDSEPVRFRYKGKSWLIEFWKGQYGMTTGAEVGIYYTRRRVGKSERAQNRAFYKCIKNKNMIPMSIRLIKERQTVFYRSARHWWLTGFVLGEFSLPEELSVQISLTFPDRDMCDAFVKALMDVGYLYNQFSVTGETVWISFERPFSKQPETRTAEREESVQKTNKQLCDAFNELTGDQQNDLDKLQICKVSDPELYSYATSFGKTLGLFRVRKKDVKRHGSS